MSEQQTTVQFVQEWMMSGDHEPNQWHRDFAAAIDARLPTEQAIFEAIKDECGTDRAARMMAAHIIVALAITPARNTSQIGEG